MFETGRCEDVTRFIFWAQRREKSERQTKVAYCYVPLLCVLVAELLDAEVLRVAILADLDHLVCQRVKHSSAGRHYCQSRYYTEHDVDQTLRYTCTQKQQQCSRLITG